MKILSLRFKNINSLAGEWHIDFTRREFTDNGLFAITGKTGSGKSSILDAILLSLYGKTPRVDVTGHNNDVMTHGTTDCYAEIVFETAGKIWKSKWLQERTRTGNLKQIERSVSDEHNKIIADKASAVTAKIEEITGLTFEQFTKVILLAQGSFAAFLQADRSDKSELLEQITGTEIYGKISCRVFERNKAEKDKLEQIIFQLGEIKILTSDEILIYNTEIVECESRKATVDVEVQVIETAKKWINDIVELRKQISEARAKLPELETQQNTAKNAMLAAVKIFDELKAEYEKQSPVFIEVRELDTKISEKTVALQPIQKTLKALNDESNKLTDRLTDNKKKLLITNEIVNKHVEWKSQNMRYESLSRSYAAIEQHNAQIENLLADLKQKQKSIDKSTKELSAQTEVYEKSKSEFETKRTNLSEKDKELIEQKDKLNTYLNGRDLHALQEELNQIEKFGKEIKNLSENIQRAIDYRSEIEVYTTAIAKHTEQEKDLRNKIESNSRIIESIAKQIDILQEHINFVETVQNFNEQRKKLEDNHACPLCGSKEHPFAKGNIPETGENKQKLILSKQEHSELLKQLQIDERHSAKTVSDREHAETNKSKTEKLLASLRMTIEQIQSSIKSHVGIISEDADCIAQLEKIRIDKQNQFKNLRQTIVKAREIDVDINKLRDEVIPKYQNEVKLAEKVMNEAEKLKIIIENNRTNAEKNVEQIGAQYNIEYEKLLASFNQYEVKSIAELKTCFQQWCANEEQLTKLAQQKVEIENELRLTEAAVENNNRQTATANNNRISVENEKQQLEDKRYQLFADKNVDDEDKRLKTVVAEREMAKRITEKSLNEADTELAKTNAVIQDGENRLQRLQAENVTDKTFEELAVEGTEKRSQSDEMAQKIGINKQILKTNSHNLARNSQKLAEKERQQTVSDKWKRLDNLIGSADGKKFRNYAQTLTFENLIVLANIQLQKMSERYVLKRAEDMSNPFELSVIDKYQNCDRRTARNLSGGEKFIVSLSLALGLANMASHNMQIDTMFIDEGFGTLDSDYLDVALTALSNLQNEGKMIGVISHLTELKERITTHIEVIQKGNGHSGINVVT
ncbi:MAG: AAA family ATPase [Prevotellaceae bacterium]|jgi:exonuclease SbcC|nr:AAA family ATPase [Prevotellaceae bacterium]